MIDALMIDGRPGACRTPVRVTATPAFVIISSCILGAVMTVVHRTSRQRPPLSAALVATAAVLASALAGVVVPGGERVDAASQVVAPTRVLDTRFGVGARAGRLGPGEVLPLRIDGITGSASTSVFVNLTTVDGDEPGFVSAWPCGQPQPATSIVNFWPGRAVPNMAVLAYSAAGICFAASSAVHLVVDVTMVTTAGEIVGVAPQRLHDSRRSVRLVPGEERPIAVAGSPGVPAGAGGAAVNVTMVNPDGPGFAVVKPCGAATDASTVNFVGGDVTAHFTLVRLEQGALCVSSSVASDVIVDSFGWLPGSGAVRTATPVRALDTRSGTGAAPGAVASGATLRLATRGVAGVGSGSGAVTVNVVAIGGAPGFVTAWPCDEQRPLASTVNIWPGAVPSNQATIKLSASGELCFQPWTADASPVHLVADVVGDVVGVSTITLPTPPTFGDLGTGVTPPPPSGRRASSAGTSPGTTAYPVPAGAIVVSPAGDDAWPGTVAQPLRTVRRALALAVPGSTIVLRGGSYGESITIDERVTIQSWPNEAVWLDGSMQVTGWVADGSAWRLSGWTAEFDVSPTYTRGAPDTDGFVDPAHPMAAHPDQVWVDGVTMRQVASRAEVAPGTFFHDRGGNALYLGTSPVGRHVRAAALGKAIRVVADGVVLRGFGVRRFAPSVPDLGAVTVERSGVLLEHVAVIESSTGGISVTRGVGVAAAGVTLRNVLVARNGFTGIHANYADGLVLDRVLADANNAERFSPSPSAAGAKITASRDLTVRDSIFRANAATGLWFDHSTYDVKVLASEFRDNARHGAFVEVSAVLRFADNIVAGNAEDGLMVNNSSHARIWNNTFVGNRRNMVLAQDDRRPSNAPWARDVRFPNDPAMTFLVGPVEHFNNVLANPRPGAPCVFCATGYATADSMAITSNGNVFSRPSASAPSVLVLWSTGRTTDDRYANLAVHTAATGDDTGSVLVDGPAVVTPYGLPTASMPGSVATQPLPADIAALLGRAAGTRHIGAF